jgi:hypothetical protein
MSTVTTLEDVSELTRGISDAWMNSRENAEEIHMMPLAIAEIQREMRRLAIDNKGRGRNKRVILDIERRLQARYAGTLHEPIRLVLEYKKYRDLFVQESMKDRPSEDERLTYSVAMNFFAQSYVRLLS